MGGNLEALLAPVSVALEVEQKLRAADEHGGISHDGKRAACRGRTDGR
jgi:hypothetical protein